MQPGNIVHFRERDWVVLPSDNDDLMLLRPLTGYVDEAVGVHKELAQLLRYSLKEEGIKPSVFPLPDPSSVSDQLSHRLLWHAARLTLREGAAPFRSLGKISIRPRAYQLVPLLMALQLDPVRMLIADDVGIGKTIEALLIARELYERGEIRRLAVLAPPYLCDQWARELEEKFNFEAVVIRSSTLSRLERMVPRNQSIYEYFPVQVISIDWAKSDRNRHQFLEFCPEFVIVDEAHGAAAATGRRGQQQRHDLLRAVARDSNRHLLLLTATPHSGIEAAFMSLLGLLDPQFAEWDMGRLTEGQRDLLARHFVQRTRSDLKKDWQDEARFPKRENEDVTYRLSQPYLKLFREVYEFCTELVKRSLQAEKRQRRVHWWGALTLLRCVMSSPAAAIQSLEKQRHKAREAEQIEIPFPAVADLEEDWLDDELPMAELEQLADEWESSEAAHLGRLVRMAQEIQVQQADEKLKACINVVRRFVDQGLAPIVWCRFVATAEYVGQQLSEKLGKDVQVAVITGRLGDEERKLKIEQIDETRPRVLVATDCLSEGINLQEKFTAVIHYDLPWNPNRLEQREGRVDRYGQKAPVVKAVRLFGEDNPVDGAVIKVLLDKAQQIYKALGTYVPVPDDSESVMEAIMQSLFFKEGSAIQLSLFPEGDRSLLLHNEWSKRAERERINRTRFAQRRIKPLEVYQELEATDKVLGTPQEVAAFVTEVAQRLAWPIQGNDPLEIDCSEGTLATLPEAIRYALPQGVHDRWRISFESPSPPGATYVGRNHPWVAAMARYVLEEALTGGQNAIASRCGVIRTADVARRTTFFLFRVRYLIHTEAAAPSLAEEVIGSGFVDEPSGARWLPPDEALELMECIQPTANLSFEEKKEWIEELLAELQPWPEDPADWGKQNPYQRAIRQAIEERADTIRERHRRLRRATGGRLRALKVVPQFPPDLLGLLIALPQPKRTAR